MLRLFPKDELIPLGGEAFGETGTAVVTILDGFAATIGYLVNAEAEHGHATIVHIVSIKTVVLPMQVNQHVYEKLTQVLQELFGIGCWHEALRIHLALLGYEIACPSAGEILIPIEVQALFLTGKQDQQGCCEDNAFFHSSISLFIIRSLVSIFHLSAALLHQHLFSVTNEDALLRAIHRTAGKVV